MNEYRITLADGVMHYMTAASKKEIRKLWARDYATVPPIKSIKTLRAA